MAELGGPLGRAQFQKKQPKYESPKARLTPSTRLRMSGDLKEEAFVRRQKVPPAGSFSGFLRTGRFG